MKYTKLMTAGALVAGLCPAAAHAQVSRVFVSVNGNDLNDCLQPASACRTLNGGIAKVDTNGEVIVIDTGSFAGANITKGVKINVPSGTIAFSASSVVVNAPAATVVIRGLTLKAFTPGSGTGIDIQAAGTVLVENSVLDGWSNGIDVQAAAGAVRLDVKDSTFRNNSNDGLLVSATGAIVTVDQSRFERSGWVGLQVLGASTASVTRSFFASNLYGVGTNHAGAVVNVTRSTVSGSGDWGAYANPGFLRVAESLITGNNVGIQNGGGATTVESFKDNLVRGNTTNTSGTITTATRQ